MQKIIQALTAMVVLAVNQVLMAMMVHAARKIGLLHIHGLPRIHRRYGEVVECASLVQLYLCD
jgi:hypothetical protein